MGDLDFLFLQSRAHFSLILCFITTIGIVCCGAGAMFFTVLKHNLHEDDWYYYLTTCFEYFAWFVVCVCVIFDVLSLINIIQTFGGS